MGLVEDTARVGAYKKNPYLFRGSASIYELTKLEVNVDNMPYAKRAFTPNFPGDDFFKVYINLRLYKHNIRV